MLNFHENKLWQEAYVALMELHDVFDPGASANVLASAGKVTAMIADGLSRKDARRGREIIGDTIGQVAVVRSHLAVCWGRKLVDDEVFKSLDDRYSNLSQSLQQYR